MQTDNRIFSFDIVIFALLFGLLPIDMLNGYLLRDVGVIATISAAQLYKFSLLGLLFIRINSTEKVILLSIFSLLLIPTAYQVVKSFNIQLIFTDTVKITKYLGSVLAFFYFRSIFINKGHLLKWVYRWILFSFIILVINIFLKLLGIGFPMYVLDTIGIGSKGFFYAGNEVSAVLIILSSFLMYWYQFYDKKMSFIIVGVLAVLTGLYLTSKTAILGTTFTFLYFFILKPNRKKSSMKKKLSFLLSFFILLPLGLYIIVEYLKTSDVMKRFSYFWNELEFQQSCPHY